MQIGAKEIYGGFMGIDLYKTMQDALRNLPRKNPKKYTRFEWDSGGMDMYRKLGSGTNAKAFLGVDDMVYLILNLDKLDYSKIYLSMYIKDKIEKKLPLPKHLPMIEYLGSTKANNKTWDLFRMPIYSMPLGRHPKWLDDSYAIEYSINRFTDENDLESFAPRLKYRANFEQFRNATKEFMEFIYWSKKHGSSGGILDVTDFNMGWDDNGTLIYVDPIIIAEEFKG